MKCLLEGAGGITPPIFLKLGGSWSKDGHAAREMVTVYSVAFFVSGSTLLLLVVGPTLKTPLPLQRKVSRHISARKQLTSFGIATQNNGGSLLGGSLFASRFVKVQGKEKTLLVRTPW